MHIRKLQRLQNAAARLIVRKTKRDSISTILKQLHWLPVRQRISFKIATLVYKCLNNSGPSYLSEMLTIRQPKRTLRSSSKFLLDENTVTTKTFGTRSFRFAGPFVWNKLPEDIKRCTDYNLFKRKLKSHLFGEAFRQRH